jgi:mono/diheme cytochrome c family protein
MIFRLQDAAIPACNRGGSMLKPWLFVSAVVLFGITASSTPGPVAQGATPAPASGQTNPVKPTEKSQAQAKEIYGTDCALCHGDTGNGKTDLASGMGLTLDDWSNPATLANKADQDLFNVIRNGKGKMPAEEAGRAKDNEVWNLVLYIRGLSRQQPAAAPADAPAPPPSN